MKEISYWHDEMSEEIARRVLSSSHFDWSVQQGAQFCAGRAAGAWQANLQESYGAYKAAERVAEKRAADKRDYAAAVLDTFDGLQQEANRNQREQAAEVRRKARNAL